MQSALSRGGQSFLGAHLKKFGGSVASTQCMNCAIDGGVVGALDSGSGAHKLVGEVRAQR